MVATLVRPSFVLAAVVSLTPAPAADPKPPAADLSARLADRVVLKQPVDAPFREVAEFLTKTFDLPILLDPSVAKTETEEGGPRADRQVKFPVMVNVRLDTLLRAACDQADAAFLVYPDHVKIVMAAGAVYETRTRKGTTDDAAEPEPATLTTADQARFKPLTERALVNARFDGVPAARVLAEVADATGANVVLAPQAAEAGKKAVTVRFANTPVDVAVRTLAEMADLGVIADGNVLLVTTPERLAARAKAEDDRRKARQTPFPFPSAAPVPAPTTAEELVALKQQNEELKQRLDEVLKQLKK